MKVDFKTLLIGLLLGICVTLSMGQRAAEPAQKLDADYRYQISAISSVENGLNQETLFILDHETKKVIRVPITGRTGLDLKRDVRW
jgi:uncharacterized protein YjiK